MRAARVPEAVSELLAEIMPGVRVVKAYLLAPDDTAEHDSTEKAMGYGVPLRITVQKSAGQTEDLVLHTAKSDEFGHNRRADRAANMLLAFDTFPRIPGHVRPVDVGTMTTRGRYVSLRGSGEFYLLTAFAKGTLYAEDLRRITRTGLVNAVDVARCEALAHKAAELHAEKYSEPKRYRRAIRDLVGHGEGIFGLVDGYPDDIPQVTSERLRAIERRCLEWRWKLRWAEGRLCRTHGDYHPFNVVFDDISELALLDASRGCEGEPADDVACMSINYLFFALEAPESWANGFRILWQTFWKRYLERTRDEEILRVAAPFFAWRCLVLANPKWYPAAHERTRDELLGLVERWLEADRIALDDAEGLFR